MSPSAAEASEWVGHLAGERASRATWALARACSVVRLGTTRGVVQTRADRSRPSANFESMPATECGETKPTFHFV
jgi:hypothetical protein